MPINYQRSRYECLGRDLIGWKMAGSKSTVYARDDENPTKIEDVDSDCVSSVYCEAADFFSLHRALKLTKTKYIASYNITSSQQC